MLDQVPPDDTVWYSRWPPVHGDAVRRGLSTRHWLRWRQRNCNEISQLIVNNSRTVSFSVPAQNVTRHKSVGIVFLPEYAKPELHLHNANLAEKKSVFCRKKNHRGIMACGKPLFMEKSQPLRKREYFFCLWKTVRIFFRFSGEKSVVDSAEKRGKEIFSESLYY